MHVEHLRRRIPLLIPVLWLAALLAVGSTAVAAASTSKQPLSNRAKGTSLAGTWKGQYSGAFSGTFTLRWTQKRSVLSGTITLSNPSGRYALGGKVNGHSIKFGAVAVGATYTGKVSGKSMRGSYKTPQGGGIWSAHKTS